MDWQAWIEMVRDNASDPVFLENIRRLLCALVLASIVGFERQRKGRPAGIRTHILVCLGSALLMVVSDTIAQDWGENGAPVWLDRGRIAAGIVTGVGFLGAGTIVNYGRDQHGLTTAAMIWFVAGIGVAVGLGLYLVSFFATLLATATVVGLDNSQSIPTRMYYTVRFTLPHPPGDITDLIHRIQGKKGLSAKPVSFSLDSENKKYTVDIRVTARSERYFKTLYETLSKEFTEANKIEVSH